MPLHRRLTTIDATFLYAEKPTQPMHVGGSMVYEGHLSRYTLVRCLDDRLHLGQGRERALVGGELDRALDPERGDDLGRRQAGLVPRQPHEAT